MDLEFVKKNAPSIMTPIIFTNLQPGEEVEIVKKGHVSRGEHEIITIK